ncbi:unnamed protein product [Nippostrongylus brasiliensis]|uniref:RBR-type E3 ubiquitin transferase n=1 Tax=Nippostrongylus brasiliensis TaxID=27835 RepID=A0A0N4Y5B2_NIPBR|nr:unnamed protein product [Nippostrongylus brasiliensis]
MWYKYYRQFETNHLPPIDLIFKLSPGYPHEKAAVDLECMWMPTSMKSKLLKQIDGVLLDNIGLPVLYNCYDVVKNFVAETKIEKISLGSNEFPRKHNMRPMEMLKLVREECEKAEATAFNNQCHDCEVCFENKTGHRCVRFSPCGHEFCKDCVKAYFEGKLRSEQISLLTCLADGCDSNASDTIIVELLGQEEFDRYEGILLDQALESMSDMLPCPRLSCQKPAAVSQTTKNLATCQFCGHNFCATCRRGYHGVAKCELAEVSVSTYSENEDGTWEIHEVSLKEYLKATPEQRIEMGWWYGGIENLEAQMEEAINKADMATYNWKQGNCKKCPYCSIPAQKEYGCNKVTCSMCHQYFCWLCNEKLNKDDPYSHFKTGPCRVDA